MNARKAKTGQEPCVKAFQKFSAATDSDPQIILTKAKHSVADRKRLRNFLQRSDAAG
jgi:hypothetical protein